MYKKNSAEEIRRFIDKLAKFLNEQIGKSIYILANDANIGMKYEVEEIFFNILENSAEEIRRFIDKLAKFLNEQIGKSIYILANDANIG
ncbi:MULTISPECIES: hypothetical protein, partial [Clostridia]|uniref:hypothetical protein n=1 Tax=Clostridia TaxID=186801 RepID=UPI000FF6F71B